MMMLALADVWVVSLGIGQLVFNALMTFAFWALSRKTKEADQLKIDLKRYSEELIDLRIKSVLAEFNASADRVSDSLKRVNARLATGDSDLKTLNERDYQLELKFHSKIDELKDAIRSGLATRAEVEDLSKRVTRVEATRGTGGAS